MLPYLTALAQEPNHPLGLLFLFLSCVIEYLFPPFPGDTITLFGAVLITAYHWSFWWMMVVLTLGNLLGATLAEALRPPKPSDALASRVPEHE